MHRPTKRLFVDMSGRVSLVLPVCDNNNCMNPSIYVHEFTQADNKVWSTMMDTCDPRPKWILQTIGFCQLGYVSRRYIFSFLFPTILTIQTYHKVIPVVFQWFTLMKCESGSDSNLCKVDSDAFGFFEPSAQEMPKFNLPITLRAGDYNMDGFQDAVMTVKLQQSDG